MEACESSCEGEVSGVSELIDGRLTIRSGVLFQERLIKKECPEFSVKAELKERSSNSMVTTSNTFITNHQKT